MSKYNPQNACMSFTARCTDRGAVPSPFVFTVAHGPYQSACAHADHAALWQLQGTGSAASDQEVAAVRKAVKDAEGEISDVKKELDAIETDITTAKAAADMEELRYLRQEKKQLREALRQLREEKLLLMQREASAT